MRRPADPLAAASPECRVLYNELLQAVSRVGPFREEIKKTTIHLVRKSAFVGVHFRKHHLIVTIKSSEPISCSRVFKTLRASPNRLYLDIRLTAAGDIDAELLRWVGESYQLSA